jgi:hypothetical protein
VPQQIGFLSPNALLCCRGDANEARRPSGLT